MCIIVGTAGGFQAKGGTVGDVYLCSHACNHDRRIAIPGFTEYGVGKYDGLSVQHVADALHYKTGVVSTSNSLDHTEMDDKMMLENDASVKDMEAAAIAWVAEQYHVPFFCLKVVTDIVDGGRHTHEEFLENLHTASVALQAAMPKIIEHVVGKKVSELN
jgi:5'-methylthioadenosine nucleosidase